MLIVVAQDPVRPGVFRQQRLVAIGQISYCVGLPIGENQVEIERQVKLVILATMLD